jgi:hypothetical protein
VTITLARRTIRPTGSWEQQIADQIRRQAIAPVDLGTGRRGEMIQRGVRQADAVHAALHVGDASRRGPGHLEVRLEVVGDVEGAVDDRRLEIDRTGFAAAVHEPRLAVVVLRGPH